MTTRSLSAPRRSTSDLLQRSIQVDLMAWSLVGAFVALFSAALGPFLGVEPRWLLGGGVATLLIGLALLLFFQSRPAGRRLVWCFAVANLDLAILVWIAAYFHWLPLTTAGTWALALAGDLMLVLGLFQFYALGKQQMPNG